MLSREHQGPRAVLNGLERLASGYGSECDRLRQDLAIAEVQLRDYQARSGLPFHLESYLSQLTLLCDQLKAGLSGISEVTNTETQLRVCTLSAQIKTLKAASTIEAAPERVQRSMPFHGSRWPLDSRAIPSLSKKVCRHTLPLGKRNVNRSLNAPRRIFLLWDSLSH
jgi:hypothetical protein